MLCYCHSARRSRAEHGGTNRTERRLLADLGAKVGNELRLAPPFTDRNGVTNEIAWLKDFVRESKSSPDAQQQLRYWTAGAPSYRWMQLLLSQIENKGLTNPRNVRALALMSIAMYDATIAAWDSKYAHKRPRPSEADPDDVQREVRAYVRSQWRNLSR